MLVFWKEKLVILAVPKTGTTALAKALGSSADIIINDPPELKHAPLYRYNRFFRPMFEKACKQEHMDVMAIMREPVSWLGSWYRYRQRDFLDGKPTSTRGISFDEFVQAYLSDDRPPFANVGSQAKFLEPRPNGTQVSHLFRYEDPARMLAFLSERLGREISLDQVNVSSQADLTLSAETRTRLQTVLSADFSLYESLNDPI
ncbi:gamma-glutamyl kinase [Cognatishimia sp. D5M38]|uniref:Gamma-glutamyl kinase n=1 Tax=Cognatishimia coralii TaxID=3083254 RepID=A0ABU8QCP0_9RHOB